MDSVGPSLMFSSMVLNVFFIKVEKTCFLRFFNLQIYILISMVCMHGSPGSLYPAPVISTVVSDVNRHQTLTHRRSQRTLGEQ